MLGPYSQSETSTEIEEQTFDGLVCRRCQQLVADPEDRYFVDGKFRHFFTNPAGLHFEIGCFFQAEGCVVVGEPTNEYTWFPGFYWAYAVCRGCGCHLGWVYSKGSAFFYGLILDRLLPRI